MKKVVWLLLVLAVAAPAAAQHGSAALVAKVKTEALAAGRLRVPAQDNCDAFQITVRVAWALRAEGAKLFLKNAGQNGCTYYNGVRYSHDAIAFPDGFADVLASAGPPANENRPSWQFTAGGPPNPALVADPFDLDAGQEPPPIIVVPPVGLDLSGVAAQLALLNAKVDELARASGEAHASINQNVSDGRAENRSFFSAIAQHWKSIVAVAAPVVSWWVAKQTGGTGAP